MGDQSDKKIDWDSLKIYTNRSGSGISSNCNFFKTEEDWYEYHQEDIKLIYRILNNYKGKHFLAQLSEDEVRDICYVFSSRKKLSV